MTPDHCPERAEHRPHEWIGGALRTNCPGGMYVVAGTGSRSLRVADRVVQVGAMERCAAALEERRRAYGARLVVMSGGAEGWDELIARCAIRLGIRLWLALPNRGYAAHYWGRASLLERDRMAEFEAIAGHAWRVTHVMEDVHNTRELKVNGKHANFWRNDFMVTGDGATFSGADDFLVWNPTSRGTAHCVEAIRKAGKWRDDMVLSPEPVATLL